MIERKVTTAIMYMAVFTNLVLAIVLWIKLQVAPNEVLNELRVMRAQVEANAVAVDSRFTAIATELDRRGEWIAEVDGELFRRTNDRIHRREMVKWRNDAAELNPDLNLPTIEATPPE